MDKRFLIVLAALVVLFGGFVWFSKSKEKAKAPSGGNESLVTSHVQGAGKKNVTLVEYGDFQCPACGAYFPIVEQVRKKYGDDIKFQFRNFPLVQVHQNAMAGHRAAEAANMQGKFWDMYELLYTNQQSWSNTTNPTAVMEQYAAQIGLDINKFKQDYSSSKVNDIINADISSGQSLNVSSTPTFFLNGKKLDPSPDRSVEAFSKLIDDAINSSAGSTKSNSQ